MNREQLRRDHPEMAAIVDELRPHITSMGFYVNEELVAGKPPVDDPGCVWVSADSYIRMRAYAASAAPVVPRSKR